MVKDRHRIEDRRALSPDERWSDTETLFLYGDEAASPRFIHTIRGIGYRMGTGR